MWIQLNLREDILKHFPNFEYFNCLEPERLNFSRTDNLVGEQQEAFINYWILKQLSEQGGIGLDIGCGQSIHFACLGLNDYYGENHPIYKGEYKPHITSRAEDIALNENTFSFIVASHILEHVEKPEVTFRKWCRLLRKDGLMILIMPDANYEVFGWDPTHLHFMTPEEFKTTVFESSRDLLDEIGFNTFNNKFSFEFLGRKK